MYCGDETGAVVLDMGSANTRIGYAGSDTPRSVFPSAVGFPVDVQGSEGTVSAKRDYSIDQALRIPRSDFEVKFPFELGITESFNSTQALIEHGYKSIYADPHEHPLLVSEPSVSLPQHQEELAEYLFESLNVPALYFSPAPVLQAFSVGRVTSLIVDIGAFGTRVSPVAEGYQLKKGTFISEVGGNAIRGAISDYMVRSGQLPQNTIWPRALVRRADPSQGRDKPEYKRNMKFTPSYLTFLRNEVVDDIKHSLFNVAEVGYDPTKEEEGSKPASYELPDGTIFTVGGARQDIPELFFKQQPISMYRSILTMRQCSAWHSLSVSSKVVALAAAQQMEGQPPNNENLPIPLQNVIYNSLKVSDPELRKDLSANILLCGGGSLLKGLDLRLRWETLAVIPTAYKPRLVVPTAPERINAAWIGGSILSSLGTFQQLWVSKKEFSEEGYRVLERKS